MNRRSFLRLLAGVSGGLSGAGAWLARSVLLAAGRPFDRAGEVYRDAVIWRLT